MPGRSPSPTLPRAARGLPGAALSRPGPPPSRLTLAGPPRAGQGPAPGRHREAAGAGGSWRSHAEPNRATSSGDPNRTAPSTSARPASAASSFGATIGDDPLLDGTAPGVTALAVFAGGVDEDTGFAGRGAQVGGEPRRGEPATGTRGSPRRRGLASSPHTPGRVVRECSQPSCESGAKGGRPGSSTPQCINVGGRTGRTGRTRPPPLRGKLRAGVQ